MKNKVCVLGATGFVGSSIAKKLTQHGYNWVGISRKAVEECNIYSIPLSNSEQLAKVFADFPYVINALGSFKPRDFQNNTNEVLEQFKRQVDLIEKALHKAPPKELINISSGGTVYGEYSRYSHSESDPLSPISEYGKAKVYEEHRLENLCSKIGSVYKCARVSNPFGNRKFTSHGFIDVLLGCIETGNVFNTFKDDEHYRDFIHADDMAEIVLNILEYDDPTSKVVFNVGSGISTKLIDILYHIQSRIENFEFQRNYKAHEYDVKKVCLNITKLKELNLLPKRLISVEEYIDKRLKLMGLKCL